jgi:hypothetical protein
MELQRSPPALPPRNKNSEDPFQGEKTDKQISIGDIIAVGEGNKSEQDPSALTEEEEKRIEEQAAQQLQDEVVRHSYASKSSGTETVREVDEKEGEDSTLEEREVSQNETPPSAEAVESPTETTTKKLDRLSLTIPGGFQP